MHETIFHIKLILIRSRLIQSIKFLALTNFEKKSKIIITLNAINKNKQRHIKNRGQNN